MRLPYILTAMLLLLVSTVFAGEIQKYFTVTTEVHAYSTQQDEFLMRYRDGKTSTGTNAYQVGVAANHKYFPVGTEIYLKEFNQTLVVDDTLPQTSGNSRKIYIRLLTKSKANAWTPKTMDVWVRKMPKPKKKRISWFTK